MVAIGLRGAAFSLVARYRQTSPNTTYSIRYRTIFY